MISPPTPRTVSASAPAKIILFGEHAAVYGEPAIAVPVSSLRATATVTLNDDDRSGLRIIAADVGATLPVDLDRDDVDHALAVAARITLRRAQVAPPNATIMLRSAIPIASGLGSGAAVTTALVRALNTALELDLAAADINAIVYEVEKIFHGTPSGIDNTVISYEQPVFFIRDRAIEPIAIPYPFSIMIADTGVQASTKIAVGDVRHLVETEPERYRPMISAIGDITRAALAAIHAGDWTTLGDLMNRNHALLRDLSVSSSELEMLVAAARDAGGLGAKLSGGGRGGNLIALITPETQAQVESTLRAAGAANLYTTTVGTAPT